MKQLPGPDLLYCNAHVQQHGVIDSHPTTRKTDVPYDVVVETSTHNLFYKFSQKFLNSGPHPRCSTTGLKEDAVVAVLASNARSGATPVPTPSDA